MLNGSWKPCHEFTSPWQTCHGFDHWVRKTGWLTKFCRLCICVNFLVYTKKEYHEHLKRYTLCGRNSHYKKCKFSTMFQLNQLEVSNVILRKAKVGVKVGRFTKVFFARLDGSLVAFSSFLSPIASLPTIVFFKLRFLQLLRKLAFIFPKFSKLYILKQFLMLKRRFMSPI